MSDSNTCFDKTSNRNFFTFLNLEKNAGNLTQIITMIHKIENKIYQEITLIWESLEVSICAISMSLAKSNSERKSNKFFSSFEFIYPSNVPKNKYIDNLCFEKSFTFSKFWTTGSFEDFI